MEFGIKKNGTHDLDIDKRKKHFLNRLKIEYPRYILIGEYKSNNIKILIEDNITGYKYKVKPSSILEGHSPSIISMIQKDKNKYIKKTLLKKHNNKYNYSKLNYKQLKDKVIIICPEHGEFSQRLSGHLEGKGCLKCSENNKGWRRSQYIKLSKGKEGVVYILKCFNKEKTEIFYKIGITFVSVKSRFAYNFPYEYEVIKEIKGSAGFIWDEEVRLHRLNKENNYKPLIEFKGYTECFSEITYE